MELIIDIIKIACMCCYHNNRIYKIHAALETRKTSPVSIKPSSFHFPDRLKTLLSRIPSKTDGKLSEHLGSLGPPESIRAFMFSGFHWSPRDLCDRAKIPGKKHFNRTGILHVEQSSAATGNKSSR